MYLRDYRKTDFEVVYALDCVCFEVRFRFSRAMMRRVVGAPGAVVVLACEEGASEPETVVGFCAVEIVREAVSGLTGYVATLDVHPDFRRRGVARQLMDEAERRVLVAGAEAMVLHVYAGNDGAVQLYKGLGYLRVGAERDFYGAGFDAWVMQKSLVDRR